MGGIFQSLAFDPFAQPSQSFWRVSRSVIITSEWFDVLAAANFGDADEVPEGWKTVREIAAETGYSEHHTWKRLRQLHEQGKIEQRRFKICTGTTVRPVPHYLAH